MAEIEHIGAILKRVFSPSRKNGSKRRNKLKTLAKRILLTLSNLNFFWSYPWILTRIIKGLHLKGA